jgi:hypothetical protein
VGGLLLFGEEVGLDRAMEKCDPALWRVGVVWGWTCFSFVSFRPADTNSDPVPVPGSATEPPSDPLVDDPLLALDVLPERSTPCRGWRNENAPSERRRSGCGSGASTDAGPSLEEGGVAGKGVVRFSIPKANGFDTALVFAGEGAAALRLLRCSFFVEDCALPALSVAPVPGSETGLGRPAFTAAFFGCGLAGGEGRQGGFMSNV